MTHTIDASDDEIDTDFHPLIVPIDTLVMPAGELPVARDGTIGGVPAYDADPPPTRAVKPKRRKTP